MTPQEAYTKWCPMTPRPGSNCIGDKCMAWRWREEVVVRALSKTTMGEPEMGSEKSDTDGYCGLAGEKK